MNCKRQSKDTKAHRNVRAIRRKDSDSNESCIEIEFEDEQVLFMEGQDSPVQITINVRKIMMEFFNFFEKIVLKSFKRVLKSKKSLKS